jgi:hypothetical protein
MRLEILIGNALIARRHGHFDALIESGYEQPESSAARPGDADPLAVNFRRVSR